MVTASAARDMLFAEVLVESFSLELLALVTMCAAQLGGGVASPTGAANDMRKLLSLFTGNRSYRFQQRLVHTNQFLVPDS